MLTHTCEQAGIHRHKHTTTARNTAANCEVERPSAPTDKHTIERIRCKRHSTEGRQVVV